jgi:Recombinase
VRYFTYPHALRKASPSVLQNPRCTGHQVWNRQRTDKDLADPADVSLGHKQVQRWNQPDGWVISREPAHEALVSEAGYIAAQGVGAARGPAPLAEVGAPERRRGRPAGPVARTGPSRTVPDRPGPVRSKDQARDRSRTSARAARSAVRTLAVPRRRGVS